MAEKENPPTLASLRANRGKPRAPKREPTQFGLFFTPEPQQPSAPHLGFEDMGGGSAIPKRSEPNPQKSSHLEEPLSIEETAPDLPTQRRIWTVRDLVIDIRRQVEGGYPDLWVEGEISNYRAAPSGHVYFTLKDGEAQLPVVLFRRQAALLRFRPADGLAVLVRGRISIYESRGQLQLIAETLEPRGAGALQLAFEQLKARLLAEGLFDAARKRPLPAFPKCIGVITSPTGAVIRDIVNVARRRHARLNLLVYPATVQGTNCCTTVAAGIRYFNAHPTLVDVIILARGGGSIEDLSGFNDESLARVIAASEIPIVSAIGHETDFTIADFVADLRAPTPSAAAELVTAAQHRVEERIQALAARILRAGRFHLLSARQRYTRLSSESVLDHLRDAISRREQHIDELSLRLNATAIHRLRIPAQRLAVLTERLRRQNISTRIAITQRRLQSVTEALLRSSARAISTHQTRLNRATTHLEALSPLAVLNRGYALVYTANGTLLRSAADTAPGEMIRARLAEGTLTAKVSDNKVTNKVTETRNS